MKVCCKEEYKIEELPDFCPMKKFANLIERSLKIYKENAQVWKIFQLAATIEYYGYMKWPRIIELIEFCKKLGIKKLGIAFCIGLSKEAEELCKVLERHGFTVYSICCKCGGIDKSKLGITEKLSKFDPICNPVLQALILNELGTELNIILGLCIGHDILFTMFSKAPVTTIAVKDRVLGHNPIVALYTSYWRSILYGKT